MELQVMWLTIVVVIGFCTLWGKLRSIGDQFGQLLILVAELVDRGNDESEVEE